jgi:hypothetical protein
MEDTNKKISESHMLAASEYLLGPYWLDRLVDGELSDAEQQRIVSTLDQIPNGWKKCALRFLESQIWTRSLQELQGEEPSLPLTATPAGTAQSPGSSLVSPTETQPKSVPGRASMRLPWTGWLSLAATVTIAFVIGNSIRFGDVDPRDMNRSVRAPENLAAAPYADPEDGTKGMGRTQFITNNNFWDGRPAIPSDVSQILKNYGARMERRSGFLRAKTIEGQSVLIPYEDIQLVPASGDPSY